MIDLPSRRSAPPDGFKRCECGALFPVEFNVCGQMTSRKLCDRCREQRANRPRIGADLPDVPPDAPRCAECWCLIGLQYGSSQTHLDADGCCPACARWARRHRGLVA